MIIEMILKHNDKWFIALLFDAKFDNLQFYFINKF